MLPGRTRIQPPQKKIANENTRAEETFAIILGFILSGTVLSPLHVLSQSILRNCMRFHYGPHFADEETGSERLSNFPKATELVTVRAGI